MSLLLAWLLMLAPTAVEGVYVAQQGETATALELEQGGRYRWLYSQGALDLTSEGKWVAEGGAIILTSDPVTPPSFAFSGTSASGKAGLIVQVLTSSGEPIPAVEVVLRYRSGRENVGHTGPGGQHHFELPSGETIEHILLALPAFELRSQEFSLSPKAGETLSFQLEPNDVGKQPFAGERLAATGKGFKLSFRGQPLDYERQEGGLEEVP